MIWLLPYSTLVEQTLIWQNLKLLCPSGDRRKEKEAQDQDVQNSFTARRQTLSHLLHFTKSNPSLCHGNQSDQRPSGTIPAHMNPAAALSNVHSNGLPRVRTHTVPKDCYRSLVCHQGLVTNWSRAGPLLI